MYNNKKHKPRANIWEQVIIVSVTLTAALIVGALGASDKWLTGIFDTVVTFGGMLSFFRPRWSSKRFWAIIAVALSIHVVLVWLILGIGLRQRSDVGLLVCVPIILLECFVLYHAVRLLDD